LGNQDVDGALNYFAENSKEMYQFNFELMQTLLPTITQDMRNITIKNLENGVAEYEMLTIQNNLERSHYIEYIRDLDGIWKISFF